MHLNLPDQRPSPGVDTRPGPLRAWLASLPYVDAANSAAAALERLRDINHQPLSAAQRLELLAAFRHGYTRLHDTLRDSLRHQDPLQPSRTTTLLADFTEAMSHGYKYALRDTFNERPRWGRTKLLSEAAHYSLYFLALLLVCRYQAYQPVADHSWREIGDLVRCAETETLTPLRDSDFPFGTGELHALNGYRQLVLLRLADPYRLPSGLIWEAYGYLAGKAQQIELLLQPPGDALPTGVYGLPLDHEPHRSLPVPSSGVERSSWRWLDARELLRTAQLDLDRILSGAPPQRLGFSARLSGGDAAQLLGRMLGQWAHDPQRKAPRFNSNQNVDLTPGLEGAYFFLNHCNAFDPSAYTAPADDDDIDFSRDPRRGSAVPAQDFRLIACPTRNRSSGGLSLHLAPVHDLALRIGQLLLLTPTDAAAGPGRDWLVGVVRWLVSKDIAGTELGIQYVARNPLPVALRATSGPAQNAHPALKSDLPLAGGQRLLTLIAPRGLFKPRAILELHQSGQARQLRCDHLLETGLGFDRFSYIELG